MELQRRGTLKAQADTMIDMKKAMNANESFTEFMRELSPVDVIGDRLGVRVNNNSALVRMWKELGGTFTEGETQHITTAKTSGEPTEIIVGDELLDLIQNNSFEEAEGVSQNIFVRVACLLWKPQILLIIQQSKLPCLKHWRNKHIQPHSALDFSVRCLVVKYRI